MEKRTTAKSRGKTCPCGAGQQQLFKDRDEEATENVPEPLDTWCFPDSGAQVCLINPKLVTALGGNDLIQRENLQIKDAGNHLLATTGCVFIVISKKNEKTGVVTKTHQQAYISEKVDDLVISREAMESMRFVSDLDDRKPASVRLLNSTVVNPYYSARASPVRSELGKSSAVRSELGKSAAARTELGSGNESSPRESRFESSLAELESTAARTRHRSRGPVRGKVHCTQEAAAEVPAGAAGAEPPEFREYDEGDRVQGGQVTLDILAMHNVDDSLCKVTLADLKPSNDPEHKCRGSLPLKNGVLTCG